MKKSSLKKHHSDFDDNFGHVKKVAVVKDKSTKKRLSIYDEYEEEEDLFPHQEKFKGRRK
jgi:hypothetical protein